MADNDKPLIDFSSGPALAGSLKDAVVKGGKAVVEGVGKGYDAVANATQDAIDTSKAVMTGSIELPEGSEVEANFFKEFGTLLSAEERAKIKAEGVVTAEMIRSKLIPKLMSIDNQAKLQKLRTTFQTHARLSGLIEVYGFAPITKGEAIPRSEANTSQFAREAKLTGKQAWSDLVQGARSYWNLNTEMDDIAVGRYLVAMRGKALISAISGIYGNEKVAENPEYLKTSGPIREWRKGDDLAEAIASKGNTKFTDITELSPVYSRSSLHNDYILALVQASSDPTKSSINIAGVTIDFGTSETAKLEMIANELDAMREGIEKADPGKFRRFLGGIYSLTAAGEAVIDVGFDVIAAPVWAINTFGALTIWILASTALVAARRGDPNYAKRGLAGKIFSAPGKVAVGGSRWAFGRQNFQSEEERTAAKANAPNPSSDAFSKPIETFLRELETKSVDMNLPAAQRKEYDRRLKALERYRDDYKKRYASGELWTTDTEGGVASEVDRIVNGRGRGGIVTALGDIKIEYGLRRGSAAATINPKTVPFTGGRTVDIGPVQDMGGAVVSGLGRTYARARGAVQASRGTEEGYGAAKKKFRDALTSSKLDQTFEVKGADGSVTTWKLRDASQFDPIDRLLIQQEEWHNITKWMKAYQAYEAEALAFKNAETSKSDWLKANPPGGMSLYTHEQHSALQSLGATYDSAKMARAQALSALSSLPSPTITQIDSTGTKTLVDLIKGLKTEPVREGEGWKMDNVAVLTGLDTAKANLLQSGSAILSTLKNAGVVWSSDPHTFRDGILSKVASRVAK